MKLVNWFKKLIRIVRDYDTDLRNTRAISNTALSEAEEARKFVYDATQLNADIHYRGESQVIVMGRFHNNDFIQTYSMGDREFSDLVRHIREMSKYHRVNRIDAPHGMKEAFLREINTGE